jgi:predicted nucleic acid-binding protein
MSTALLDTGIWFGYFDKNDLFHHQAEIKFWDEILPANFPRLFLKSMDFIVASCALYWEVDEFYSFDEKLNKALRRVKPEIVKLKIKHGRAMRC